MSHPNHHRLGLIAFGTPAEHKHVIDNAPEHFLDAATELLAKQRHIMDANLKQAHDLLRHPRASLASKRQLLQHGSGLGSMLAGLGSKLLGGLGSVAKTILGSPVAREVAGDLAKKAGAHIVKKATEKVEKL